MSGKAVSSPLRGAIWRCSNCGEPAEPDDGTLVDARYALGSCKAKGCPLRARVPLVLGTREQLDTLIEDRAERELFQKQVNLLRVGAIPNHPYARGCCDVKQEAGHLTASRLEKLMESLTMRSA